MQPTSEPFFQLSHLQKLRRCEQVAAVCYRNTRAGLEFLLVQTRGGRWTFPKGSTEPGLTHAQAAAIEAFEEAGVHGRIEEAAFGQYAAGAQHIHAHLCEVKRQETPQEFGRDPKWFTAVQAKRRLREGRKPEEARDLRELIDRAVQRVAEQRRDAIREKAFLEMKKDPLRKVRFEAGRTEGWKSGFAGRTIHGSATLRRAKVLQLMAPREIDLGKGSRRLP